MTFYVKYIIFIKFKTSRGALAQSVEQRTENPCVPSSILGGATNDTKGLQGFVIPFLVSEIDYNVTTKGCF